MKQKLFLTSCIAMGFVAPAIAETFPSDGYMAENTTYENAATAENMDSVYEGTVNAVAEYNIVDYILSAGMYLPADSETPTTCPAGSFCSGIGSVNYNQNLAQGIETCPTGYALSADGATSADECYRQCTASDVAHSKSTGTFTGMFYSNNTNACEPVNDASCANGYHYKEGFAGFDSSIKATSTRYKSINGTGQNSSDTTGLNNGDWDATFSYGNITGKALCSTTNKTGSDRYPTGTPDESGTGLYCWCQIDGFTPTGGSKQSLSGSWVFSNARNSADGCAKDCAYNCADVLRISAELRAALLGTVQSSPAICEANTITINWSNADAEDISANNAGTATYGSDVRTPVKAETIKGKTFKGWKFSKPTTTNLP